jgi:hypothetical protein
VTSHYVDCFLIAALTLTPTAKLGVHRFKWRG